MLHYINFTRTYETTVSVVTLRICTRSLCVLLSYCGRITVSKYHHWIFKPTEHTTHWGNCKTIV